MRVAISGRVLQLPVQWVREEGMSNLDLRFIGPLAAQLLRESHSYWDESKVSFLALDGFLCILIKLLILNLNFKKLTFELPDRDGDFLVEIVWRQHALMLIIDQFCSAFCVAWNTGGQGKTFSLLKRIFEFHFYNFDFDFILDG